MSRRDAPSQLDDARLRLRRTVELQPVRGENTLEWRRIGVERSAGQAASAVGASPGTGGSGCVRVGRSDAPLQHVDTPETRRCAPTLPSVSEKGRTTSEIITKQNPYEPATTTQMKEPGGGATLSVGEAGGGHEIRA